MPTYSQFFAAQVQGMDPFNVDLVPEEVIVRQGSTPSLSEVEVFL